MGGGSYSSESRVKSGRSVMYANNSITENFRERTINLAMNPYGVLIRESRDSEEHPNSIAIVLALDVTGSMGSIPQFLVQDGLPSFMDRIIGGGVPDPQVLFTGIGDHECDDAPLQVSQFESSDDMLDHWLTKLYLEGGGGGNDGESYLLAWYFAGKHTAIDCLEKRKKKGYLFTIGDEKCLPEIPKNSIKKIMGKGQFENFTRAELLDMAREKYHVYHLHLREGYNGERKEVMDEWKQVMGDHLIVVQDKKDVANIMAEIVDSHESDKGIKSDPIEAKKEKKQEVIL